MEFANLLTILELAVPDDNHHSVFGIINYNIVQNNNTFLITIQTSKNNYAFHIKYFITFSHKRWRFHNLLAYDIEVIKNSCSTHPYRA